jgi:hypothetical protein
MDMTWLVNTIWDLDFGISLDVGGWCLEFHFRYLQPFTIVNLPPLLYIGACAPFDQARTIGSLHCLGLACAWVGGQGVSGEASSFVRGNHRTGQSEVITK